MCLITRIRLPTRLINWEHSAYIHTCHRHATSACDEYTATLYTYNVAQRQRNRLFFEEARLAARTTQRNGIFEGKQEKKNFNLRGKKAHTLIQRTGVLQND